MAKVKGVRIILDKEDCVVNFSNMVDGQYSPRQGQFVKVLRKDLENCKEKVKFTMQMHVIKKSKSGKALEDGIRILWKQEGFSLKNGNISPIKDGDKIAKMLEEKNKSGDRLVGKWQITAGGSKDLIQQNIDDAKLGKNGVIFDEYGIMFPERDDFIAGRKSKVILYAMPYQGMGGGVTLYVNGMQLFEVHPDYSFGEVSNEFEFATKPVEKEKPSDFTFKNGNKTNVSNDDDDDVTDELNEDEMPF